MPFNKIILFLGLLFLGAGCVSADMLGNKSACNQLFTMFPEHIFWPGSDNFTVESNDDIWSKTCVLTPACVFSPLTASDIAQGLSIIRDTQTTFSVRSGGHMPVVGAQSDNGGVLIALTNLKTMEFNADKTVASIGPGNRWSDVYTWTADYGLAVAGGRYGQVGVGGLLVGGGFNFFVNRVGWSINTIVGMQVVLANSSIVEVSRCSYPDLFWAIRGGNNNFGIVTRFDIKTLPVTSVYGGGIIWESKQATEQLIEAIQAFILPGGGIEDINTEINPSIEVLPANGTYMPNILPFVMGNYSSTPQSIKNFTSINGSIYDVVYQRASWVAIPEDVAAFDSDSLRQSFSSIGLKAAPGVVRLAFEEVIEPSFKELANVTNGLISVAYQPVSKAMLNAAKNSGGDALDLDPADGPFVSILISGSWSDAADDQVMQTYSARAGERLVIKAQKLGVYYDFIYLNDASPDQYPYSTYGNGKSLPRLKSIQKLYDPDGVFQNLETSGFKL